MVSYSTFKKGFCNAGITKATVKDYTFPQLGWPASQQVDSDPFTVNGATWELH